MLARVFLERGRGRWATRARPCAHKQNTVFAAAAATNTHPNVVQDDRSRAAYLHVYLSVHAVSAKLHVAAESGAQQLHRALTEAQAQKQLAARSHRPRRRSARACLRRAAHSVITLAKICPRAGWQVGRLRPAARRAADATRERVATHRAADSRRRRLRAGARATRRRAPARTTQSDPAPAPVVAAAQRAHSAAASASWPAGARAA